MTISTPWGASDFSNKLAYGIVFYGTARHGGIHLSSSRLAQMPAYFKNNTFCGQPEWYEEDCDWCMVALVFPEAFKPEQREEARKMMEKYKPELLAKFDADPKFNNA